MKKIYLAAPLLLALAAASCTKSEVLETNSGEIMFNVVANKATKATAIYDNNNLPEDFYVYAISNGATYIDGDLIKHSNGAWVNQSGTRFWPEANVDFYALRNADNFDWDVASPAVPSFEFTVASTVAEQKDLLYSVRKDEAPRTDPDANSPVSLNFRHALSQIVFQAKNTNPNIYVRVEGVKLANVYGTGTFTLPDANTDNNIKDEPSTLPGDATGWGTWTSPLTGDLQTYEIGFTAVELAGDQTNPDVKALGTATPDAMMLIPQQTDAWVPKTEGSELTKNSYFLVKCAIWNVAGDAYENGDVVVWGDESTGTLKTAWAAIPASFDWEQGHKYIYTFIFGEGGGYIPGDKPDPDPTLIPVGFEVTVDDFVVVDNDIDLNPNAGA